ncbi:MAG: hypothetical protein JST06_05585 [Bacteroidetes bacterium]|nr:hypothetical protein [Bacteroidota bacterium]MBS1628598.1 hypothetical protein [Bacteroidota bacterium]
MKKMYWVMLAVVLVVTIVGGSVMYHIASPGVNIEEADALPIKAETLAAAFNQNESTASGSYMNKALAVTGMVEKVGTNQDGFPTVLMSGTDPLSGVFFTLRDKGQTVPQGAIATIKGFCTGKTTDVVLNQCIVVRN